LIAVLQFQCDRATVSHWHCYCSIINREKKVCDNTKVYEVKIGRTDDRQEQEQEQEQTLRVL
jgi:hypothetical protein